MTAPVVPAPIAVRGHPTDAELAALAGALLALRAAAAAAAEADEPGRRPAGWTSRRQQLRLPPAPGPGAWRASSRV